MEKIPFKKAKEMCSDSFSGFTLITGEQHISLPPRFLGNISEGVRAHLNSKIGFYSERLGGVPMAYSNVRLQGSKGQILDDAPFVHFSVQTDMVLFKPCVGARLAAEVNKVGKDHLGLLVHGRFNVAIPLGEGVHASPSASLAKGDHCEFTVTRLHTHRNLLSLRGRLD